MITKIPKTTLFIFQKNVHLVFLLHSLVYNMNFVQLKQKVPNYIFVKNDLITYSCTLALPASNDHSKKKKLCTKNVYSNQKHFYRLTDM